MKLHSRPLKRTAFRSGPGKRERVRRLSSLGLSTHDNEDVQNKALAIVERFLDWTRASRCCVTGWRTGEVHDWHGMAYQVVIEAAHAVRSRGAWGSDFGCVVPLTDLHHRAQHTDPDFFATHELDPVVVARTHALRFFESHPEDRAWLLEFCQDGDVLALAREAAGA